MWRRRIERRYLPLVRRALDGDADAARTPVASPIRHRVAIASFLITPFIDNRDPQHIAKTRSLVLYISLIPFADRLVRSWLWWRRALALRALGLMQQRSHGGGRRRARRSASRRPGRGAGRADRTCATSPRFTAVVVRLHDASLQPARRLAALAAFGPECEEFLLDLSQVDPRTWPTTRAPSRSAARAGRARRSREWTRDARSEVRAAAFEALAHVGLDDRSGQPGDRGARERRRTRTRDGRVRTERLEWLRRRRRAPGSAPRRCLAGCRARGALAPLDGQPRARLSCRRWRRAPISPACSRARCCRRWAHDADGDRQLRAARLQRVGHRVLRALECVADGDEPDRPVFLSASPGAVPAPRPRAGRAPRLATVRLRHRARVQRGAHDRRERPRLLALDYEAREIIVVNDGSSDGTLAVLHGVSARAGAAAFAQPLKTAAVRGIYRSVSEPALVVVDKVNGGSKSDAVTPVQRRVRDARAEHRRRYLLEPDALSRAVMPFLEDPSTVAVGGNIAISNGCRIENGRITAVALPRSWLARFQIVEYMRAFLLFRLACAAANGVVLISGAFGLFRRDAVIAVGGFDRDGDRRGHGSDDPAAAALPRARRADPDRVRSQPARLDAGARGLAFAEIAAIPVAPRPAAGALAISADDWQPALRRRRARSDSVHSRVRRVGSAAGAGELRGCDGGPPPWRP